jgi:predicted phosphoadenosine phosphosulfate sulfurtransferase
LLNPRQDTYQQFLPRLNDGVVCLVGLRVAESLQRYRTIASQKVIRRAYPIYDWTDKDVWRYIRDNNLEIPDAYQYMYQVGTKKSAMRISQFFSIDTAKSLVNMCEYYPDLFNKICKREPNAYMAMLYFDTELFRRQKQRSQANPDEEIDFKAKVLELFNTPGYFATEEQQRILRKIKRFVLLNAPVMDNSTYKVAYNILIGGDPKDRTYRALCTHVGELKCKEKKK